MPRVAFALVATALTAGFYLLLIDTVDLAELCAGAGVVLLAAAVFEAAREQRLETASLAPRWLAGAWRPILKVPGQTLLLSRDALAQLLRPQASRGAMCAVAFGTRGDARRDAGRRALAEALGSLAPNTIVIGVDPDRGLLLAHQLHRQGGHDELDVLLLG